MEGSKGAESEDEAAELTEEIPQCLVTERKEGSKIFGTGERGVQQARSGSALVMARLECAGVSSSPDVFVYGTNNTGYTYDTIRATQ
jgi:hypothetical protein